MTQELKIPFSDITEELENIDLGMHFEVITLKLRECALHEPGNDLEKDKEITALENKLLSLQEDILEKTAKVKISNDEDFKIVKKLWQSAVDLKHDRDLNLLDRLALTLFQYTERKPLNR